jgi:hypothetical protein
MPEPTHLDGGMIPPLPGAPGSGGSSLAPIQRRIVTWGPDGQPIVANAPLFTKTQIADITLAAAAMLYTDPNDELAIAMGLPPSRFHGMTNLEVMLIKRQEYAAATGDPDVIAQIEDRLVGKPKTTNENHTLVETYDQVLARIGKAAAAKAKPVDVVMDAQIVDDLEGL